MKKPAHIILLIVLILGSFLGGIWFSHGKAANGAAAQAGRKVLYYVDPMNPSHTSDRPGKAPCGMDMEPVYAEEGAEGGAGTSCFLPAGSVKITPERQQLIGVRLEKVETSSQGYALRTLGKVAADENRTFAVTAGDEGWVWKVKAGTTGSIVHKDDLLATIYNYAFITREQQFLYALDYDERRRRPWGKPAGAQDADSMSGEAKTPATRSQPRSFEMPNISMIPTSPGNSAEMSEGNSSTVVYSVRDQLSVAKLELFNLGVSEHQLQEIGRTKQLTLDLEVRSPVDGLVLSRSITALQKFAKGSELYRIADLSHVWILADVFEKEAPYVKPGTPVRVSLPQQNKVFEATVSDVPPVFDPVTRSFKVRLDADNEGVQLRPDMYVDVEFLLHFPPAITVPTDAVLDAGLSKTVFVSTGNGYFEPRMVETGRRFGGRIEILNGVMPGEEVVVSGNFLVDSESKMKLAAAGMNGEQEKDPVCGMPVYAGQAKKSGLVKDQNGEIYYFCSEACKKQFLKNPDQFSRKPMGMGHVHSGPAAGGGGEMAAEVHDAVCAMPIDPVKAQEAGFTAEFQGKTYYFCSEDCRDRFKKNPERYLNAGTAEKPPAEPMDPAHHMDHGQHMAPMPSMDHSPQMDHKNPMADMSKKDQMAPGASPMEHKMEMNPSQPMDSKGSMEETGQKTQMNPSPSMEPKESTSPAHSMSGTGQMGTMGKQDDMDKMGHSGPAGQSGASPMGSPMKNEGAAQ